MYTYPVCFYGYYLQIDEVLQEQWDAMPVDDQMKFIPMGSDVKHLMSGLMKTKSSGREYQLRHIVRARSHWERLTLKDCSPGTKFTRIFNPKLYFVSGYNLGQDLELNGWQGHLNQNQMISGR